MKARQGVWTTLFATSNMDKLKTVMTILCGFVSDSRVSPNKWPRSDANAMSKAAITTAMTPPKMNGRWRSKLDWQWSM